MSSIAKESLIHNQVQNLLLLTVNRRKTSESKLAVLNREKNEKQRQLEAADDKIIEFQKDLERYKKDSNKFLNSGGLIPKNYIPHRDREIKIFHSRISQAIKEKETILKEIKELEKKIIDIQKEINEKSKKEEKFKLFEDLQNN